jgi:hypothetical protein
MGNSDFKPYTRVPKSGYYHCVMCKNFDSALRDAFRKSGGYDSHILDIAFGAAGIGSEDPVSEKFFIQGDTFSECPKHKGATGWSE